MGLAPCLRYAPSMRLYDDPVRYDVLHTPGTAEESRALARIYRAETGQDLPNETVLEPACGTGRLLRRFSARGSRTIGFDSNHAMIDYAQRRLPQGSWFVAKMAGFSSALTRSSVGLAINTINTIRHLGSDPALLQHLEEMCHILRPDGRYLIGLSLVDYDHDTISEDLWEGVRGSLHVQQVIQYLPSDRESRTERVLSHVRVLWPGGEQSWDESYSLRAYDHEQWLRMLDRSPLQLTRVYDISGRELVDPDPGYSIYSLRPGQVDRS